MNYYGDHKWTAGAGTTVTAGIAAGVAGLNLLNNGGLGGIFGGGCNNSLQKENSALLAEVGQLKAEKYTDAQVANLYNTVRALEKDSAETKSGLICLQKELTTYETSQREIQELYRQLAAKDVAGVAKDLNCLAGKVDSGFCGINNRFASIDARINSFTETVIPASAICDTSGCNRCCGAQQ
jgi:hypothetical protein